MSLIVEYMLLGVEDGMYMSTKFLAYLFNLNNELENSKKKFYKRAL